MAKSRYTNWSWQPTSKVERQITTGRQRFTTARELQISLTIGEYTMEQVKAALESVFGPMVTTRKVVARKAKKSMTDKPSVRVPTSIKGSPVTGRAAVARKAIAPKVAATKTAKRTGTDESSGSIALKSIVPASMDTKMARRILRKAMSHMGGRWMFTQVEADKARAILTAKIAKA